MTIFGGFVFVIILGVHFCDYLWGFIFVTIFGGPLGWQIFGVHFCDHFGGFIFVTIFGVHWDGKFLVYIL